MPQITKQILVPGTYLVKYCDANGRQHVEPVTFDRASLRHYEREGKAMIAAGVKIPVPLEHQDEALPFSQADRLADSVRHNSGWVTDFALRRDGLWATLDVTDEAIVPKLKTSIRYVSPQINPHVVAGNREWRNVIAHVALTPQPVQFDQRPFGDDGAALTPITPPVLREAMKFSNWAQSGQVLRLSLGNQAVFQSGRWIRLSGGSMADERDDDVDDTADAEDTAATPPAPPAMNHFAEAKAILDRLGLALPAATTPENLCEHICVAGHALLNSQDDTSKTPDEDEEEDMADVQRAPSREEPQLISMSVEAQNAVTAANARAAAAEKRLADKEHDHLATEIDRLVRRGQCSPADATAWKSKLGAKKLSIVAGDDMGVREALAEIRQAKKVPRGTFWSDEQKTEHAKQLSTASHEEPKPQWGDDDPKACEEVIDYLSGRKKRKKEAAS